MRFVKGLKSYTTVEWLMFIGIVAFQSPWFIWGYGLSTMIQYISIILLFLVFYKQHRLKGSKGTIMFLILLMYFVIGQVFHEVHLSYAFIALAYFLAIRIRDNESNNVINLLTWYIFLSVAIPLPLWLIHQYVMPIPTIGILDIGAMKGTGSTLMENHFFFVSYKDLDAMRFYSWFDEPGVLGTLAPFILYANKFNMKDKRIPIILVGCIFTFSMAYFVLTLVGWIYTGRKSVKSMVATIVGMLVVGFGAFYTMQNNEAFQGSVVARIINPEEHGLESRLSYDTDALYKRTQESGKLVFGLGSGAMNDYGGMAASYKSFLTEFGYVGLIVLILAYLSIIRRKNTETLFTLFLFVLSFLQRPQLFTAGWFLLFASVIGMMSHEVVNHQIRRLRA